LAEGRSIDHTTLSEFRRKYPEPLKDLFVQIGLLARELGWLSLEQLAFDGTRIRADNRRSRSRTPAELREMREKLAARYAELEAQLTAADAHDQEVFGDASPPDLLEELADTRRLQARVDAALEELRRVEAAGETVPQRIPLTDPQSRITPNKDGGFAPNYTPLATVDVASGLIVSAEVIAMTDEDKHLAAAVDDVTQSFGLAHTPPEVLADSMMATVENLLEMDQREVVLYSPLAGQSNQPNPALRDDPTQPVPAEQWANLPTKPVGRKGAQRPQLLKSAFVYDAERACYWCPQGKALEYAHTTSESVRNRRVVRHRYKATAEMCAGCPLRELCLQGQAQARQINHGEHEQRRIEHAERMATPAAQEKYAKRRHPGERPFAVIKQHFGARRFLLRGLARVGNEWKWLTSAFNLHRLLGLIQSGADPPGLPAT
jgi:hypothetical protein